MFGLSFGLNFLIIASVAVAAGLLARRFHLPTIFGYIVGGIAIGPFGFALIHDPDVVNSFADLGVILLLFTVGLEFPIKEFIQLGRITIIGGFTQILLTAAAGLLLGLLLVPNLLEAGFLGFLIAFSSTMIGLKILTERGELDSEYGRILIGILLIQDIAVIPLVILVPLLNGSESGLLISLGLAVLKAVGFIAVTVVLGLWVIPWLFRRVANERFRELFLLTVIILILASAIGSYFLGLSYAFGGFVAGLLLGQSIFARQAVADVIPLRDAFVALFFVALGMLFDPQFLIRNPVVVILAVIIIIIIKFLIGFGIPWIAGLHFRTSLFVGVGLIPIGEFSFVLAGIGKQANFISDYIYSLVLAGAIVTLFLSPFSFSLISSLYRRFSQSSKFKSVIERHPLRVSEKKLELSRHVVICGYGKIGTALAEVLERRNFPYVVIDLNPYIVSKLRNQNVPSLYGDSSSREILAQAQLNKALVLVCSFSDSLATELTVRNSHNINPNLHIITRVNKNVDASLIVKYGASETVLPEFEASLEMIRYTLRRYGVSSLEIQSILARLREDE